MIINNRSIFRSVYYPFRGGGYTDNATRLIRVKKGETKKKIIGKNDYLNYKHVLQVALKLYFFLKI